MTLLSWCAAGKAFNHSCHSLAFEYKGLGTEWCASYECITAMLMALQAKVKANKCAASYNWAEKKIKICDCLFQQQQRSQNAMHTHYLAKKSVAILWAGKRNFAGRPPRAGCDISDKRKTVPYVHSLRSALLMR